MDFIKWDQLTNTNKSTRTNVHKILQMWGEKKKKNLFLFTNMSKAASLWQVGLQVVWIFKGTGERKNIAKSTST